MAADDESDNELTSEEESLVLEFQVSLFKSVTVQGNIINLTFSKT